MLRFADFELAGTKVRDEIAEVVDLEDLPGPDTLAGSGRKDGSCLRLVLDETSKLCGLRLA